MSPFRGIIGRVISPVKVVTKSHGPPSTGSQGSKKCIALNFDASFKKPLLMKGEVPTCWSCPKQVIYVGAHRGIPIFGKIHLRFCLKKFSHSLAIESMRDPRYPKRCAPTLPCQAHCRSAGGRITLALADVTMQGSL